MGLAEVAGGDGTVDGAHDLAQGDLRRIMGEDVSAADAALGTDKAGALEGQEDLLEIGLRESGALGDVPDRRRTVGVGVQGERQESPACVVTPGRHLHSSQVSAASQDGTGTETHTVGSWLPSPTPCCPRTAGRASTALFRLLSIANGAHRTGCLRSRR